MKAARIVNVNEPLQVQELQTPKPKGSIKEGELKKITQILDEITKTR